MTDLPVQKISETSTAITLGWTPPSDQWGYVPTIDGNEKLTDGKRHIGVGETTAKVTIGKPPGETNPVSKHRYGVKILGVDAEGSYPSVPATGPPVATDGSVDVTAGIQRWLDGLRDSSTGVFAPGALYRVDGTLVLSNRTGLILDGNGATFRSPNPGDGHRPNFQVRDGGGNTLKNMLIDGGYTNPGVLTDSLQWSHGVELLGAADTTVRNVTIRNVSGDGVYCGLGARRSRGTRILDITVDGTGRNGVSAVASDDLVVSGGEYDKIGYIAFDCEPNPGLGHGVNGAVFDGATVGAYAQTVGTIVGDNQIDNVTFSNLRITAARGAKFQCGTQRRWRNVAYLNNTADYATPLGYAIQAANIDGLTVTGNKLPTGGVLLACESCTAVTFNGNTPNSQRGCL